MKKVKDTSWAGCKVMMGAGDFLKSLVEFDKDGITEKQVNQIQKYMKDPAFNPISLQKISVAGAGLLKWVFAMVNYYSVAKEINPMRNAVKKAEMELSAAQKGLARVKKELKELAEMLDQLKVELEEATLEKNTLKEAADTMARQLAAAEKLINGLASEQTRWKGDMADLHANRANLLGDCLVTSSFLSYLGAFNFDFRQNLIINKYAHDKMSVSLRRVILTCLLVRC
jgi:dynein heavy chain